MPWRRISSENLIYPFFWYFYIWLFALVQLPSLVFSDSAHSGSAASEKQTTMIVNGRKCLFEDIKRKFETLSISIALDMCIHTQENKPQRTWVAQVVKNIKRALYLSDSHIIWISDAMIIDTSLYREAAKQKRDSKALWLK